MFIHVHTPAFAAFSGLLSTFEIPHQALEGNTTHQGKATWAMIQRYQYTYASVSFIAHFSTRYKIRGLMLPTLFCT